MLCDFSLCYFFRSYGDFCLSPMSRRMFLLFLSGLLLSSGTFAASAAPGSVAQCDCAEPFRSYTRAITPDVQALFDAAAGVDEARFSELIPKIPDVGEYAIKGVPLLSVLLSPAKTLLTPEEALQGWWDMPETRRKTILSQHVASLPAKVRMLALALKQGASVSDTSYEALRPPLQLAIAWGSTEMVRLLLAHGADVNQVSPQDGQTALEMALDPEFYRSVVGFRPAFVTPEVRTEMIGLLLDAGAQRPFKSFDERWRNKQPSADNLLWPSAAMLTRGGAVLRRLSALGTVPAAGKGLAKPLVLAARTGNLGGLRWLQKNMSRQGEIERRYAGQWRKEPIDFWLQAATWALYPYRGFGELGASRDEILKALIEPKMHWLQPNELSSDGEARGDQLSGPTAGTTLLHHLVHVGDESWVEKVVRMGAPVDGAPEDSRTPLVQAIRDGNLSMVNRLLQLGANPLTPHLETSPLFEIVKPQWRSFALSAAEEARQNGIRKNMLVAILAALKPEQKARLTEADSSPLIALFYANRVPDGEIVRTLFAAGLQLPALTENAWAAVVRENSELAGFLLDHGVRVQVMGVRQPVLAEALYSSKPELVARLLAAGADPNLPDQRGMTAVAWAILRGDVTTLDLLLAKGGKLEKALKDQSPVALHELAIRSNSDAVLTRLSLKGADLAPLCFSDKWDLSNIVLDSNDTFWAGLLKQGFGKSSGADCPREPSSERLIQAVLDDPLTYEAGWSGERLVTRLAALTRYAPIAPKRGRELMASAVAAGRRDVVQALQGVGFTTPSASRKVSAPPPLTAAERLAMRRLAGNYYLQDAREVGSELRLTADGHFSFMLAYGAVDQAARGQWWIKNSELRFQTPEVVESADWLPYRRITPPQAEGNLKANEIRVRVGYRNRVVNDVNVTVFGCKAPERESGITSEGLWSGVVNGPLCQIVLRHPNIQQGRPYVYEVSSEEGGANVRDFIFEVEPGKQDTNQGFNVRMRHQGKALLWANEGRIWRYEKE